MGRLLGGQPHPEPVLQPALPAAVRADRGVVFLHVAALHITGSNNPLGIDVKGPQDTLPFHPYYTVKDSVGLCVFLIVLRLPGVLRAELAGRAG